MRTLPRIAAALFLAALLFSLGAVPATQAFPGGVVRGFAFDDLNKNGVRDTGEPSLAGTVICLVGYNWCDHTEWGEFEFDMLDPGTYTFELTAMPDGYFLLSPNPVTVVVPEGDSVTRLDFALSNAPEGVIRGKAFLDADRDGTRDPLEQNVDDVYVCLVGYNWCAFTEYGDYEFDYLPPGDYTVRVMSFPKGYHRTSPLSVYVTLADAEIRADVDFGFRRDNRKGK